MRRCRALRGISASRRVRVPQVSILRPGNLQILIGAYRAMKYISQLSTIAEATKSTKQ
jgi:hypothetical protein